MVRVSVIIPIYRVEEYLDECLKSVVHQTLDNIEIICVDDGSPDRSGEIAAAWAEKYNNIKLLRKNNGGLSSARNAGIRHAEGKYVYFLDSDDYLDLHALEELYDKAEQDELDIVYFNAVPFFENARVKNAHSNYVRYYKRQGQYSGVYTGQTLFSMMNKNREFLSSACLQMIRRDLLLENNIMFYEGILHEDNLFSFQCAMIAGRTGYLDQEYYHRRVHDDSIMTSKLTMRNVEGYIVSYAEMLAFLHNREIEENAVPVIMDYLYNSIYKGGYNIYQKLDESEKESSMVHGGFLTDYFLTGIKNDNERCVLKENKIKKLVLYLKDYGVSYTLYKIVGKIARKVKWIDERLKKNRLYKKLTYILGLFLKVPSFIRKYGIKSLFRSIHVKNYQRVGNELPLVSVIMPVYNVEHFVEKALDTLVHQTMKYIEIIVVDDGSTDNSLNILKEYEKKDERIHVFTQENQYAGAARNLGLAHAKGEYVIFLDADDFFSQNLVKDAYFHARLHDADVILFGAKHFNHKTQKYSNADWLLNTFIIPKKQPFNYTSCSEKLYQMTTPCPWTKMFRREFVVNSGLCFQSLQNSNDVYFVYSAMAMAKRIVALDRILVYYRVGQTTNLQATKSKNPLCFYEAYRAWHDKLIELGIINELRQSFVNRTLSGCLYNLRTQNDVLVKEIIYNKLKNEIFNELEIVGHESDFYYNKEDYHEMLCIEENDFEQYLEIRNKPMG